MAGTPTGRRPRWLIVNGDDLGLTGGVNAGIERAFRDGILRSASLMAAGTALADGAERARRLPGLGIGLHLALVGERPVCPPDQVPSLVGRDGWLLPGYRAFLSRYLRGGIRPDDVRRELEAQATAAAALGLPLDHIDSHQHLHLLPGLTGPTLDLARAHNISWVRAPRPLHADARHQPSVVVPTVPPIRRSGHPVIRSSPQRSRAERVLFAIASAWARRRLARAGFPLTDGSLGFDCAGHLTAGYLLERIPLLPAGVTELICHPGQGDPETQERYQAWGYQWKGELEALTDRGVLAALELAGVQLASFASVTSDQ